MYTINDKIISKPANNIYKEFRTTSADNLIIICKIKITYMIKEKL